MPRTATSIAKVHAVITGDIVGSTKLRPKKMAAVRQIITQAVHSFLLHQGVPGREVEFFQGDSWQVFLSDPCHALNLTLLIKARLLAEADVETRASIGIGIAEGLEASNAISTGEAFTLSGRALAAIPAAFHITGAQPKHADPTGKWLPSLLHLCSALTQNWTDRQAAALALWLSLPAPSYEAIAERLGITKQSVGERLKVAGLPALREAMALFHTTDWQRQAGPQEEELP